MKKLIFVVLLVAIDQISKILLDSSRNYGAAFGILQGWKWLFIVISIFVLGYLFYYESRIKSYGCYGWILLVSGIVGNLLDRLVLGYVRDFIDLGFFPSFNLADAYSTIGVALLVGHLWKW